MKNKPILVKRLFKKTDSFSDSSLEINRYYSEKNIKELKYFKTPTYIKKIIQDYNIKKILDLGCGEGSMINSLDKDFLRLNISGLDLSNTKINNLKKLFPQYQFYNQDACDTHLKSESFELINCSQLIEHVKNDSVLVKEMKRLLKPGGFLFADSVIKKPWAVSKWKRGGRFVLDPSHEREYKNSREFLRLFRGDFNLLKFWVIPFFSRSLFIKIPIPGYYKIHGIWRKRKK